MLVASLPGIIFGAVEANRNYTIASRTEAVVRTDDATRAAVRLDDLLRAAAEQGAVVASREEVRNATGACAPSLRAAIGTQSRYIAFERVNAGGAVICGSAPLKGRADVGGHDWFKRLKSGGDYGVSTLMPTPFSAEPGVIVAVPIHDGRALQGALLVVLPQKALRDSVLSEIRSDAGAIVAYDRRGALIASAAREVDAKKASDAAALALVASRGSSTANGLIAERVSGNGEFFHIVAVTPQRKQADIGLRSALILLAPVLGAVLSFAVVWLVMDLWVLRWFYRLQDLAHDFGAGRYTPIKMQAAPTEISDLAAAFDGAVADVRARQQDLTAVLGANKSLTRELHHRVKNNLQVLSSLISRQQRRAADPAIRDALSEARARMTPVALVYRFINPPEDLAGVDLAPYLTELSRQLHVALAGEARGVTLEIDVPPTSCSADDTTNIGLIVAETMITGYANAIGAGGALAELRLERVDGAPVLRVKVANAAPSGQEVDLDSDLIVEVARQLGAHVQVDGYSAIQLALRHEREMDKV